MPIGSRCRSGLGPACAAKLWSVPGDTGAGEGTVLLAGAAGIDPRDVLAAPSPGEGGAQLLPQPCPDAALREDAVAGDGDWPSARPLPGRGQRLLAGCLCLAWGWAQPACWKGQGGTRAAQLLP